MKKFNLVKERIEVDKSLLMQAILTGKLFGITYEGNVVYEPFKGTDIFIYQGVIKPQSSSMLSDPKPKSLQELFGGKYSIVEEENKALFDAAEAWNEVMQFNVNNISYDDTTSDGIAEFTDQVLEDIGWQATEFNISYREISELIEARCEGVLFCVEKDEPYYFSGQGFISDLECAREKVFNFCQQKVEEALKNDPEFARDSLTDDEEEAARFFKVI